MKSFISTISLVAILALAAPVVGTEATARFEVDPSHSKVLFKVRHLGISTVTGQFKNFSASFDLDPSDLSTLKAKAVIDVASVDGAELADETGRWAELREVGPAGALLVRPDRHVAFRAMELPADPEAALRSALDATLPR